MSEEYSNTVKLVTILDYCSFLCLIGLFVAKENEDVRFHTNQGLLLAIIELTGAVVLSVLQVVPIIGTIFTVVGVLFGVACLALSLWGVVHAIREEKTPLPVIGTVFNLIK